MSSPFLYMLSKTTTTKSESSDRPEINIAAIHGEPGTGYEDGGNKGEFECENCEYFERETSSCGQADMMRMSKRDKVAGSERIIVDPEGCCEYVTRVGKEDTDKDKKE